MYRSAASRTTHANETFFCLAISSRTLYSSGGKLTDARNEATLGVLLSFSCFLLAFMFSAPGFQPCTTLHHIGVLANYIFWRTRSVARSVGSGVHFQGRLLGGQCEGLDEAKSSRY